MKFRVLFHTLIPPPACEFCLKVVLQIKIRVLSNVLLSYFWKQCHHFEVQSAAILCCCNSTIILICWIVSECSVISEVHSAVWRYNSSTSCCTMLFLKVVLPLKFKLLFNTMIPPPFFLAEIYFGKLNCFKLLFDAAIPPPFISAKLFLKVVLPLKFKLLYILKFFHHIFLLNCFGKLSCYWASNCCLMLQFLQHLFLLSFV